MWRAEFISHSTQILHLQGSPAAVQPPRVCCFLMWVQFQREKFLNVHGTEQRVGERVLPPRKPLAASSLGASRCRPGTCGGVRSGQSPTGRAGPWARVPSPLHMRVALGRGHFGRFLQLRHSRPPRRPLPEALGFCQSPHRAGVGVQAPPLAAGRRPLPSPASSLSSHCPS